VSISQKAHRSLPRVASLRLLVAPMIAAAATSAVAADFTGVVVGVTDGDTITILVRNSGNQVVKVRLHGIDCPEPGQGFSAQAKKFTSDACFGKTVKVSDHGADKYGRTVGEVWLPDGSSLNVALVRSGLARWFEKYAPGDEELRGAQVQAEVARGGCGKTVMRSHLGSFAPSDGLASLPQSHRDKRLRCHCRHHRLCRVPRRPAM
jgi:micrococcal nuclease